MAKLLVCDDEEGLRAVIKRYAVFEGYEVTEAKNGMEAIAYCKEQKFDIIIMDVMMPELDGFSAVREIRKLTATPVIMLSARGEEYDKIIGFEVGVDDYVVKPFSSKELMMRVGAILRRVTRSEEGHMVFEKQGLKVDMTAYRVFVDNQEVSLAPKAYDLLAFLIQHKDRALTRDQILQEVWGYDYFGDDRTLDTHMKLLRKALGTYAVWITTIRGVGYRFDS